MSRAEVRIGHGFDAHRFGPGDGVVLGGVRIAAAFGVIAHSDGDVLLHALCDALLGAAALGDIGHHFPDSDPALAGVDSRAMLRHVAALLAQRGLHVCNADLTLIAEVPRVAAHVDAMRAHIAVDLGVGVEAINVKATTTEGMGYIGRREGLAAQAVVSVGS